MNNNNVLQGLQRQTQSGAELDHPHYIALSLIDTWMKQIALHEAHGVMLDYGCGGQPYRTLFSSKITQYIGADIAAALGIKLDIEIEPGKQLNLEDRSIDTLLSSQTLEHVSDVDFYLSECMRLVKPNGVMLITVPMQWRHHEIPHDYFRFTKYGLITLLEKHGFEVKSITPCGGVYALIGQIFLSHLHERGGKRKMVNKFVNRIAMWLDKRISDEEDTLVWMCVANRNINITKV